jgi:2-polyprenyl-6-methoxyphenol hydroxylase-like FAD-dependent oxidoreductase
MSAPKPIQIVGGGLAGLTLGIALRKKEIPVTLFEAGNYPRHRVCGEFISGRGLEFSTRFGLKEKFLDAGATEARLLDFLFWPIRIAGAPIAVVRALPFAFRHGQTARGRISKTRWRIADWHALAK